MKNHIPNLITLLNLFAGSIALVAAIEGNLMFASWLVLGCMVLDFSDGMAARLLHATSPIGKQLDSLADLVSFGMVPSAIVYSYLKASQHSGMTGPAALLPYIAFALAVFAALRLAKFNIDTRQSTNFIGLPTPANALFFVAFPLAAGMLPTETFVAEVFQKIIHSSWAWLVLTAAFSWLMVSPIPMISLKFSSLNVRDNMVRYLFLAFSLLCILIFTWAALALIIVAYVIISLLFRNRIAI